MEIRLSPRASIFWDNSGAPFVHFYGLDRSGGWGGILRLPNWKAVAREILPHLPEVDDVDDALAQLEELRAVFIEIGDILLALAQQRSSLLYEICGMGNASVDSVRAIWLAHRHQTTTQAAKREITKRRRYQFNRERDVLMLRLIESGVPYVCAIDGCPVSEDLTIDHVLALSRGGADELENLRFLCQPHNSEKGDRDA